MKTATLKPLDTVPFQMLHFPSATVLVKKGEPLTDEAIALFKKKGIREVVIPDGEPLDQLRRELTQTSIAVDSLTAGEKLPRTLYDNGGQLLLQAETPIPKNFTESLKRRGIDNIFTRKPAEELMAEMAQEVRQEIEGMRPKTRRKGKKRDNKGVIDDKKVEELEKIQLEEADKDDLDAKKLRDKINALSNIEVLPEGQAFSQSITDTRDIGPVSAVEKEVFSDTITDSLDTVRALFEDLEAARRTVDVDAIDSLTAQVMGGLIRNRELLVLCGIGKNQEEYLVSHSMATMVVAINIGTAMGFDAAQIKSLAYGALLGDVGMLKIDKEIRNKPGKLNPRERAEVRLHPSHGLDILQRINRIPSTVPYIVYQSHERANGSGYPCGKKDVVIHPFARIVATADIYTSVISERPYRPAKTPYEAMEDLLRMCGKRMINSDVMRSFLACSSLVPVGSFVRLSNSLMGRVVAANPEDYTRPVVALLWDAEGNRVPKQERVNLLKQKELAVKQALAESDVDLGGDPLFGF